MQIITGILSWVGRKAILWLALIAALLTYAIWTSGDIKNVVLKEPELHLAQATKLDSFVEQLKIEHRGAADELVRLGKWAQTAPVAELESELLEARQKKAVLMAEQSSAPRALLNLAILDTKAILKDRQRELQIAFVTKKIDGLERASAVAKEHDTLLNRVRAGFMKFARATADAIKDTKKVEREAKEKWDAAAKNCSKVPTRIAAFDRQQWWKREWQQRIGQERSKIVRNANAICGSVKKLKQKYIHARDNRINLENRKDRSAATAGRAYVWVETDLPIIGDDLRERAQEEKERADRHITAKAKRFWEKYKVKRILKSAAVALIIIIVSPFVIRLFCYFLLAPLAMMRSSIQLAAPGGTGAPIPLAPRSTTSVGVRLDAQEELLVRQDFLQTTSRVGGQRTQWFLDWLKPLTSFASGMFFLTRIRGDGETATISAAHDPFAEVTILKLPDGSSCVLQPRTLAAVVQPIRRRLRVTTQWRLGSLNAWLTMQLRYVVFHGPARLILKGGRGVRVEQAEKGRIFGQNQLVGFSADLGYSVTRTETFWPYFFGREQLLKDKVEAGEGVLILEEAPMAGRRGGQTRRGIEGMIDAGLKVVGI